MDVGIGACSKERDHRDHTAPCAPASVATSSGVPPVLLRMFGSAPSRTSSRTTLVAPSMTVPLAGAGYGRRRTVLCYYPMRAAMPNTSTITMQ